MSMYHCQRCDRTRDSNEVEIVLFDGDNELICVDCMSEEEYNQWEHQGWGTLPGKSTQEDQQWPK